jgi:hypothetical protein
MSGPSGACVAFLIPSMDFVERIVAAPKIEFVHMNGRLASVGAHPTLWMWAVKVVRTFLY